jgi:acyl-CoA thioester hydrolase
VERETSVADIASPVRYSIPGLTHCTRILTVMRATMDPELDPGAYGFVHRLRVRFAETDAMGVVHHAAYLPYLEEARVAYLRAAGRPYPAIRAGGTDIAVVEAHVRYRSPLRFDDLVDVHVRLGSPTASTFQIAYLLAVDDRAAATAVTVHACLDAATGRPRRVDPWLADLAAQSEEGARL